jgi:DNA-binding response OmpR family regulator
VNKILIIEDCRVTSELLKSILTARGFECSTAMDGLEGLRAAKEIKPDLILLDVMLPTMNGFKVCRLLKFDKEFKNIPIIMLTSRSRTEDTEIGISTGADAYIQKPLETGSLIAEMERLLSKSLEGKHPV